MTCAVLPRLLYVNVKIFKELTFIPRPHERKEPIEPFVKRCETRFISSYGFYLPAVLRRAEPGCSSRRPHSMSVSGKRLRSYVLT